MTKENTLYDIFVIIFTCVFEIILVLLFKNTSTWELYKKITLANRYTPLVYYKVTLSIAYRYKLNRVNNWKCVSAKLGDTATAQGTIFELT